jgi:hypothetical protein
MMLGLTRLPDGSLQLDDWNCFATISLHASLAEAKNLAFRVSGSRGSGFRLHRLGFELLDSGFWGLGCGVWGWNLRISATMSTRRPFILGLILSRSFSG